MLNKLKKIRNFALAYLREKKYKGLYQKKIGKFILSDKVASEIIYTTIVNNESCFISRFGSTELSTIIFYLQARKKNLEINRWTEQNNILCKVSGYFPFTQEAMDRFCKFYIGFIQNIDVLGVWEVGEENVAALFHTKIKLIKLRAIEPYYSVKPWSRALAGKKVLVIHPFAASIKSQYAKRELLFPGTDILPAFQLQVIPAVQSIAENRAGFNDWFEALDFMSEQIKKIDFDVAIIGAGAYGMPLANFIKMSLGKTAIHMGGATQLLFGIKGKRWEEHPYISKLYNEHWIYPSNEEIPANYKTVENGCYW